MPKTSGVRILQIVALSAPSIALVAEHFGAKIAERSRIPNLIDRVRLCVADATLELAARFGDATYRNMKTLECCATERLSLAEII